MAKRKSREQQIIECADEISLAQIKMHKTLKRLFPIGSSFYAKTRADMRQHKLFVVEGHGEMSGRSGEIWAMDVALAKLKYVDVAFFIQFCPERFKPYE